MPASNRSLNDIVVQAFCPQAGTSTGKRGYVISPTFGKLIEAGFTLDSACASTITMALAIGSQVNSQASTFTQCITSTVGTFASQVLQEGCICSAIPTVTSATINMDDLIQFTFSGGAGSTIGATVYAVIRRTFYDTTS